MTLTENFKASINFPTKATLDNCVKISEEFAIGFAEWIKDDGGVIALLKGSRTPKELLEIYKKENGL